MSCLLYTSFTDCSQIPKGLPRSKSGIYALTTGKETFLAMCEIDDNEGWTVLQRRQNSTFNFNRTWAEYQRGFGHLRGDFWMGLDFIHKLTFGEDFHLRINVETKTGDVFSSTYASFRILQESRNYILKVGGIINDDGGPVISNAIRAKFSTYDMNNSFNRNNCALEYGGGWWFTTCGYSCFINGLYTSSFKCNINEGMHQLSSSVMMIKRV
ncbi:ficolin-1-A-like [Anneissia japonica]|uniref:ficolin-1-A-like n=1 Tax=Anneissia japonica TaxID=1529436 RepID=UPI001425B348|nr:ficolin-1-A-like [Anneissia japonica]